MSQITKEDNIEISNYLDANNAKLTRKLADFLVDVIEARRKAEALEAEAKATLKEILKPVYFGVNESAQDQTDVVHTFDLNELQVNFVNSYIFKDDNHLQQVIKLLDSKHPLVDCIDQQAHLSIALDGLNEYDRTELVKAVTEVTLDYNIRPKVVATAQATQDFHDLRHVYLRTEDNLALDELLPVQVQITPIV